MKAARLILRFLVLSVCVLEYSKCNGSKKYNRYLAHLFNKYGTGGTMSFEGLEHLMYNLGLGGLEFGPTHTIEEHHPDGYKLPEFFIDGDEQELIKETDGDKRTQVKIEPQSSDSKNSKLLETTKYGNLENGKLKDVAEEILDSEIQNDITNLGGKPNFKEMHDPKHRHPRHHDDNNAISAARCLSPLSLMKLVIDHDDQMINGRKLNEMVRKKTKRHTETANSNGEDDEDYENLLTDVGITPTTFMKICPALLVQIDQDACAQQIVDTDHQLSKDDYFNAWIYASVAIFIISCCGLFGVAIVPLTKSTSYHEVLKFLVAIAVGTLCGDALMHLLPHALVPAHGEADQGDEHDHNEPVWLCACAFITAMFMYSLETLLPLIKGSSEHSHGHSHHTFQPPNDNSRADIDMEIVPSEDRPKELNIMLDEEKLDKKERKPLSPVALMVILGDGLHNLTDGLAIGAAFASEPVTGMATALAVLCHELPHELGDFALLLKTGVDINRAIYLNIVSSVLSFIGMAIGLIVAGIHTNMVRWIYAGTAGSFLYIALTDLIPEMGRDGKHDLKNCLIQILGIMIGGAIMMVIALNEDDIKLLFE